MSIDSKFGTTSRMTGIAGWVNVRHDPPSACSALEAMSGVDASFAINGWSREFSDSNAISTLPGVVEASAQRVGTLFTAVEGRVCWRTPDLRRMAQQQGAEVALAHAYRSLGDRCLDEMSGPFAIVVIDTASNSGLLAIDRIGIRTMAYAKLRDGLVFSSTIDGVSRHPGITCRVSNQAIFDYLFCHIVPSPGTIYEGVHKLLPGECITLREGMVNRRFYWRLAYSDDANQSVATLRPRFRELMQEAIRRAAGEDEAIGAFLSGGTDSSTVTGLLTQVRGAPVQTYSIGFSAPGFDEMSYARITGRHFGTSGHEYYVTPQDVVDAIPIISQSYDEPFGNDSAVPTYLCARMASADGIKVLLAGDGGDEIFGGNVRYAKQKVFESYALIPGLLRQSLTEPLARFAGAQSIPILRKLRSYVRQASIPLPDRLESYNFLIRTPLEEILERGFLAQIDVDSPLARAREVYQRAESGSPINRMMHLDLKQTLADNDLRKVTRMCAVAGVEVRYPLLDEALVEFSGEIPVALKVKGLRLRYFFKEALRDFLPAETIAKTKHGFGLPFGLWLKEHPPLNEFGRSSLAAFGNRGIIQRRYLQDLLRQHETTHATYFGTMIWVIMMLEQWLQTRKL